MSGGGAEDKLAGTQTVVGITEAGIYRPEGGGRGSKYGNGTGKGQR